jgi:hypothetical protein
VARLAAAVPIRSANPLNTTHVHNRGTIGAAPGSRSTIRLPHFPNTKGNAAHEEGHNNFMADCPNCANGGRVMGSQSTDAGNQPLAPTDCDIYWYLLCDALF